MSGSNTLYALQETMPRHLMAVDHAWLAQQQAEMAAQMQAVSTGLGFASLAFSAFMAAGEVYGAYQQAAQLDVAQALKLTQERLRQQAAMTERLVALAQAADRAERRQQRMKALADQFGIVVDAPAPSRPPCGDHAALQAYIEAQEKQYAAIEAALMVAANDLQRRGKQGDLASLAGVEAESFDDLMSVFSAQASMVQGLVSTEVVANLDHARQILKRLGTSIPVDLEALVQELTLTRSAERAESLLTELRFRAQQHEKIVTEQAARRGAAQAALASLPESPLFDPLRQALALAAAGILPYDDRLQALVVQMREKVDAIEIVMRERAAARVLEQSLKDLGYAVEPVAETLFIEGGMLHFQRSDWGEYFVRMRVDAQNHAANLHVVRVAEADAPARPQEDLLADNRWCAEYSMLQKTLAARGLILDTQHQFMGGELAVPRIAPSLVAQVGTSTESAWHPVPAAAKAIK